MDTLQILTEFGFKRTPLRIKILEELSREQYPVNTETLREKIPDADPVTLYRALEAFAEVGIIERSDFEHGHAHYELRIGRSHHHHLICKSCGKIADVPAQPREHLNQDALKSSRGFAQIDRHSLEFYGQCVTCI